MRIRPRTLLVALFLVALSLFIGGCRAVTGPEAKNEGKYVSRKTIDSITPGETSAAWVLAVLGEPTERTVVSPSHAIWKYAYNETKTSGGYIFLVVGANKTKVADRAVFIEIENDIVKKTWRG